MTTADAATAADRVAAPAGHPEPTAAADSPMTGRQVPLGPTTGATPSSVQRPPLRLHARWHRAVKRSFDLLIGVPLLVLALPLLVVLLALVRLSSPGPVLFRQQRPGRDGRTFTIYKLRTMRVDAEQILAADAALRQEFIANGYKLPLDRDPRVTAVGRFLRRTSLDELPQLLNVVLGTMSLVGPRPVLLEQAEELFGDDLDVYFAVKPGLTGLWQVSGRSSLTHEERARLDAAYVRCWSPMLDLKLLVRTVPAVLAARGAY